jgi:hypothetical protein
MVRLLKAGALLLALGLAACATKGADERAEDGHYLGSPPVSIAATPYYVEFHSRPSIITGHTYIVYGEQDATGKQRTHTVTGFVPMGGIVGLLGGMVAAPGRIEKSYLDERLPDVNVYRVNLTPEQYEKLAKFVDGQVGKTQVWNMFVNNCNDFAADAAEVVGLKVPSNRFLPPPIFVHNLSDLNA